MRIAIDLTPLLPGSCNGGAKIMTLQLIKELSLVAPQNKYILLASKKNYDELSLLKNSNITIICTSSFSHFSVSRCLIFLLSLGMHFLGKLSNKVLPSSIYTRLMHKYHQFRTNLMAKDLAHFVKADLLFCPFTAPFYYELNVPVVSVIYDLQSYYYPYFFTPSERYERKKNFESACRWSKKLVCISDFVRQTVIENSSVEPQNIKTIYIRLPNRLKENAKENSSVLENLSLSKNNFLLFPANFWPHKNHLMLFTAFNIYRTKNPDKTIKLVCTGTENAYKYFLVDAIKEMGLQDFIHLPGYLSNEDFSELLSNCLALIYPSLYEGFGMPLLEAMAAGVPVLCSHLASLPEVANKGALYFNPKKPTEIADAIFRIQEDHVLKNTLVREGLERVKYFGTGKDMAEEYLKIFNEAIQNS